MSILRLFLALAIVSAVCMAADDIHGCPIPNLAGVNFYEPPAECSMAHNCTQSMCGCLGFQLDPLGNCTFGKTDCNTWQTCASLAYSCVNNAAEILIAADGSGSSECDNWARGIHTDILAMMSGTLKFQDSEMFQWCEYDACDLRNITGGCDLQPWNVCISPLEIPVTLRASGNHWIAAIGGTQEGHQDKVGDSIHFDLAGLFNTSCRAPGNALTPGSIASNFGFPDAITPTIVGDMAAGSASSDWFVNTKKTYKQLGGKDNLTVFGFTVNTPAPSSGGGACPIGCIIGIVIAAIVLIAGISFAVYWFKFRKPPPAVGEPTMNAPSIDLQPQGQPEIQPAADAPAPAAV